MAGSKNPLPLGMGSVKIRQKECTSIDYLELGDEICKRHRMSKDNILKSLESK